MRQAKRAHDAVLEREGLREGERESICREGRSREGAREGGPGATPWLAASVRCKVGNSALHVANKKDLALCCVWFKSVCLLCALFCVHACTRFVSQAMINF